MKRDLTSIHRKVRLQSALLIALDTPGVCASMEPVRIEHMSQATLASDPEPALASPESWFPAVYLLESRPCFMRPSQQA